MANSSQAFPLPALYKNNLQLSWGSATTLTVAAGQSRNSDNTFDITSSALTINAAVNGENGLDTGTLAANTFYAALQISADINNRVPAFLLTALATVATPVYPIGYNISDVVGYWVTDSSANLLKGYVVGNGNLRRHYHDASIPVLTAGAAVALTAISLATAVPAIDNTPVLLTAAFTPATAGDKASFAPGGSTATVLPFVSGTVATKASTDNFVQLSKLVTGVPTILYINSAASGALSAWVDGFEYFV